MVQVERYGVLSVAAVDAAHPHLERVYEPLALGYDPCMAFHVARVHGGHAAFRATPAVVVFR